MHTYTVGRGVHNQIKLFTFHTFFWCFGGLRFQPCQHFWHKISARFGEIDFKFLLVFAVVWPISPKKRPIDGKLSYSHFVKPCWVALAFGSMLKTCHL